MSDSTQQWAELTEVIDCSQESADSLLVLWSGHVDNCLDSHWVGLKAVDGNDVAHENCFPHKEFHSAEVSLHVVLFEALKYGNEVVVMFDPGFCVCGATPWN